MSATSYNPNDPVQSSFLAAIAKGESGGKGAAAANLGFGGVDLSNAPTDAFGFPKWGGANVNGQPTHAAGIYQFQPGTWDSIASAHNLNFQNVADQNAGAWINASQSYSAATGRDLESDLQAGNFGDVAKVLSGQWTSLTPSELSDAFGSGATAAAGGASGASGSASWYNIPQAIDNAIGTFEAGAKNIFVRGSAVMIGALVLAFGLYFLVSENGYAPRLSSVAKAAAT